jgi:hypothetical protein
MRSNRGIAFFLLRLLLLLLSPPTYAERVTGVEEVLPDLSKTDRSDFLAPNERNPREMAPFAAAIPNDSVLGYVGTERGPMEAVLSKKIGYLLAMDCSSSVVAYNLINRSLMQIAGPDRALYIRLRWFADEKEWNQQVENSPHLDARIKAWMKKGAAAWWKEHVRNSTDPNSIAFHLPDSPQFRGAKYLFADAQYQKLQKMARGGKWEIHQINLQKDMEKFDALMAGMQRQQRRLGILDFSNAWLHGFIEPETTIALTRRVPASVIEDNSVMLLTDEKTGGEGFGYFGYTFGWMRKERDSRLEIYRVLERIGEHDETAYFDKHLNGHLFGGSPVENAKAICRRATRKLWKPE